MSTMPRRAGEVTFAADGEFAQSSDEEQAEIIAKVKGKIIEWINDVPYVVADGIRYTCRLVPKTK